MASTAHGSGPRVAQIVEMLGERLDNPELSLLFARPFRLALLRGRHAQLRPPGPSPDLQRKMDDFR
ncbi:hypothetical protein [Nonomuraea dietziae]|uniref:Uncharacterized protein n=1 Tax=Nonomuraea dietziae TaxID=65515 RepID=A0A7W5YKX9_9ACTN|nr:hypothetical protein [Nonomuraea dietziae]MBB3724597.1 hypothetical protein [Nonomuraea dietziae]